MPFKIDPPFSDFMQNGINTGVSDLISNMNENEDNFVEITKTYEEPEKSIPEKVNKNYKIQNLFWLLNPKILSGGELDSTESMFCTISFNIDFGNLRIQFLNLEKDTCIKKNVFFLNEMTPLIDGVIYQTDCYRILTETNNSFYIFENLITFTNEDWQHKRPLLHIEKTPSYIKLCMENYNGTIKYNYVFNDYQKEIFLYACKYAITTGLQLTGMNKIHN